MCNECGNCAIFCPYDSAPYRDKFTLFKTREGFDESVSNQGFLPLGGEQGPGPAGREGLRGGFERRERPARRH